MSNCPVCDGKTEVKDSRPTRTTDLRRRRHCTLCGFRFMTIEIPVHHPRTREIADWAADEARRIFYQEEKAGEGRSRV